MCMEFKDWLYNAFIEDAKRRKKRPIITDLARRLQTSQPTVSRWLNGDTLPDDEGARKLAKIFGPQVYEVLEKEPPSTLIKALYFSPLKPIDHEEMNMIFTQASAMVANIKDDTEREEAYIHYLAIRGIEHISTHFEEKLDDLETDELGDMINELSDEDREDVIRLIKDRNDRKGAQQGDTSKSRTIPAGAAS